MHRKVHTLAIQLCKGRCNSEASMGSGSELEPGREQTNEIRRCID